MFSSTITAPSTMMPKSIAPSESRLAGMPRMLQADEGGQQRQRDDDRDDAGGAQVAEKQVQHDRDQQRAFEQVLEDRVQRRVDQPGAVVVRHDAARPSAGSLAFSAATRSLTAASTSDGFSPLRISTMPVTISSSSSCPTRPWRGTAPIVDVGDVADQQRRAAVLGDDDVADVVARAQQADAANQVLLFALLEVAAAGVRVAAAERREDLLQRDVVRLHAARCRRSPGTA